MSYKPHTHPWHAPPPGGGGINSTMPTLKPCNNQADPKPQWSYQECPKAILQTTYNCLEPNNLCDKILREECSKIKIFVNDTLHPPMQWQNPPSLGPSHTLAFQAWAGSLPANWLCPAQREG